MYYWWYLLLLRQVKYMPHNPTNTISTGALKRNDGFITDIHDVGTSFILQHKLKQHNKFNSFTGMKFNNGMDYLPVKVTNFLLRTQIQTPQTKMAVTRSRRLPYFKAR